MTSVKWIDLNIWTIVHVLMGYEYVYASQTTRKWFSQFKKNLTANWKLFSNATIKVNALQNKISQSDLSFE